ncbi:hypothetical protein AVW09_15165 [Microbacterium sp. T32]|nr:hypothetical protein AVW09_15165 [Microbacterium sp. T32]
MSLDPGLVRDIKHRSIDEQISLSDLVAQVFTAYLKGKTSMNAAPRIILQPMVHVEDMASAVTALEVLGAHVLQGSRDGDWVQLSVGGAEVGLLAHPANPEQGEGDVELNFQSHEALENIATRARAAGVEIASPVTDEGFGRQLQLRTADGLLMKINEIDTDLIT